MAVVPFLFFSISGGEIFIILLFILVFFGADKIPGLARTMGKTIRQVKDATSEIQRDINTSVRHVKDQIEDQSHHSDRKSE
jgi:sec-independent protein translocase protein TatA